MQKFTMLIYQALYIVLLALVVTGLPILERRDSDNKFDCKGKDKGVYPDRGTRCQRFYFCNKGETHAYDCPEGTTFDSRINSCKHTPEPRCHDEEDVIKPRSFSETAMYRRANEQPDCEGKADGYYADVSKKCERFYRCADGKQKKNFKCEPGQLFDNTRVACVLQDSTRCSSATSKRQFPERQIKFDRIDQIMSELEELASLLKENH